MVALSLSSVISDCSTATLSPADTSSSMTSTSSNSPMSGTNTWRSGATAQLLIAWALIAQTLIGLGFLVSIPYLR
jgi:hypothetical protein